jgi:mono/diheme cytochrome c family protein
MYRCKLLIILTFILIVAPACFNSGPEVFKISDSKQYEASLFRQNCAICHGAEGEGKTIDDGTVVPSLRTGEFKFKTEAEIHKQIAEGGNGMLPFRNQLTDREITLLTELIRNKLRANEVK